MIAYIHFIIRRRLLVLGVIFMITAVFGAITTHGIIASSIGNIFFGNHPDYQRYLERIRTFASDEVFIIAYADADPLSPAGLKKLASVVDEIVEIPDVDRVDSVLNAQHTFVDDDTLHVYKYGREALDNSERRGDLLKIYREDDLYSGFLISPDGQHSAVIVELEPSRDRPVERGPLIVREVLDLFEKNGYDAGAIHRVGLMATLSEIMAQSYYNISRLFPMVCTVLLLTVYLLFRKFWPVFITFAVSLIAVIWAMGFAVLIDRNINIFIAMVPAVILIVATSDVIHLCCAYLLELTQGKEKKEAIITSGHEVGTACFMTSVTTFVGFISLTLIPVPAFRQLGVVLGFGVAVALLIAMTLAPILFSYMKEPKPWDAGRPGMFRAVTFLLNIAERVSVNHPWTVISTFVLLTGVSLFGLTRLNIETDFNRRLAPDNPIRVDEKYFKTHFAGTNFLDIFIDTPGEEGILDPETFLKIAEFQREVENLPQVNRVISLVNLVEQIDGELNPERRGTLPRDLTRELLAQYLLLFEMSGGQDLERMVDFDRQSMRLAVRLPDNAVRATYAMGLDIEKMGRKRLGGEIKVEGTGMNYLMGMFLYDIIEGQRNGLIMAFFSILTLMIIWLRSLKAGAWSMIPNLLPLLALGGLVAILWDEVDSDVIMIAIIAIGIGVDDTIHYLVRFKFETARNCDTVTAIHRTFHYTGRAIIITTLILAVGFAPFATSDYFSTRMMGTLLPFTLIIALLTDLLLVTALIRVGMIRFRPRPDGGSRAID